MSRDRLSEAFSRMDKTLNRLEAVVVYLYEGNDLRVLEEELLLVREDRQRLAEALDDKTACAQALEATLRELDVRLEEMFSKVAAMKGDAA